VTVFGQTFRGHHVIGDVHRAGKGWECTTDWWPTFSSGGPTMHAATQSFHDLLPLAVDYHHRQECTERCICPTRQTASLRLQPTTYSQGDR
jgi:hypothetical protein